MDEFRANLCKIKFQQIFREKTGMEFQQWFEKIAKQELGPDFEPVRSHGKSGDYKCDGKQISTNTIFQCYAPEKENLSNLKRKIDLDFKGAKEKWGSWMKKWVFVYNQSGLPPQVSQQIDELRNHNRPTIEIEVWLEQDLLNKVLEFDPNGQSVVLGPIPSFQVMGQLGIPEIESILDSIKLSEGDATNTNLSPPTLQKINFNNLSPEAVEFIKMGRLKSHLVKKCVSNESIVGKSELIASAFRTQYQSLKDMELSSEEIFKHLLKFVGFGGSPVEMIGQMAILTYFFDSCDIFENAGDSELRS